MVLVNAGTSAFCRGGFFSPRFTLFTCSSSEDPRPFYLFRGVVRPSSAIPTRAGRIGSPTSRQESRSLRLFHRVPPSARPVRGIGLDSGPHLCTGNVCTRTWALLILSQGQPPDTDDVSWSLPEGPTLPLRLTVATGWVIFIPTMHHDSRQPPCSS